MNQGQDRWGMGWTPRRMRGWAICGWIVCSTGTVSVVACGEHGQEGPAGSGGRTSGSGGDVVGDGDGDTLSPGGQNGEGSGGSNQNGACTVFPADNPWN